MNNTLSDALDVSYGNTPLEQLTNIIFENKEKLDDKNYAVMNELVLKINNQIMSNNNICHWFCFEICTELINATDDIKEQLDDCSETYNSDYENEYETEDVDDIQCIKTTGMCKLYLDTKVYSHEFLDSYMDFHDHIKEALCHDKSYMNYQASMSVLNNLHSKKIVKFVKDNIDYRWLKVVDTYVKYISLLPLEDIS